MKFDGIIPSLMFEANFYGHCRYIHHPSHYTNLPGVVNPKIPGFIIFPWFSYSVVAIGGVKLWRPTSPSIRARPAAAGANVIVIEAAEFAPPIGWRRHGEIMSRIAIWKMGYMNSNMIAIAGKWTLILPKLTTIGFDPPPYLG